MKRHLNTLFVLTQDSYLAKDGECIAVRVDHQTKARIPAHTLESIVCFGQIGCSPQLMAHCAENGIGFTYLTLYGRFLATVQGAQAGNVLLRRTQYRWADDPTRSAALARWVLKAKLHNARVSLRRAARETGSDMARDALTKAADGQAAAIMRLDREADLDGLRGVEGDAAATYWSAFNYLIGRDEPAFNFAGRNRRPPRDAVNCLLSFLYTICAHDLRGALQGVGLDPYVGYLHRDRPGRASLALDMMEEFRPFLVDRLVLSLINRRQVSEASFQTLDGGGVVMDDEARKEVLAAWQKRKQDTITHPFLGETVPIGLLFHLQALLLARHIRGDLDGYPAFLWS